MAQGNNAQAIAYQLEKVIKKVQDAMQRDHLLFDKIEKRPVEVTAMRALAWALDLVPGTKTRQVDPDGGNAGRGAAIQAARAQTSVAFFEAATEMTDLAMSATDSADKAVADFAKRNMEKQVVQFRNFCESLLNSDSNAAGIFDTITSIAGTVIGVNNANMFQGQKDFQVLPGVGQASRGSITILNVDVNAKQLYLSTALPPGTIVGDVLVIDGSPGIANSSLQSLASNHLDSNVQAWNNLPRASFPGQLKTPHVAMNNFAVTPSSVKLGLNYLRRVLPAEMELDLLVHMGFDQDQALENYAYMANPTIIWNETKGDRNIDMIKKQSAETVAGYPKLVSKQARPGRIDCLHLKSWFRGELRPIGPLERGGQTVFQTYGDDGGLPFSQINYIWGGFQVGLENPKCGLYFDGCAIPTGM